ncbi:MAG: aminotransferase class III-fold pyridoxal phosphate-dependent enzyme, partial [Hyphomicrobium sp.]|nr:aminotransferase class III-fold pyridoxal phosphate-dependent enzyme [Hyphomicrobium sp.]
AAAGMTAGVHGTTFGGNPLAMAVGNAVLDVILEKGFLEDVQRKGLAFKQALASVIDEFPSVFEEIRGAGLLLGLKCKAPNAAVNAAFRDQRREFSRRGLVTNRVDIGDVVRDRTHSVRLDRHSRDARSHYSVETHRHSPGRA